MNGAPELGRWKLCGGRGRASRNLLGSQPIAASDWQSEDRLNVEWDLLGGDVVDRYSREGRAEVKRSDESAEIKEDSSWRALDDATRRRGLSWELNVMTSKSPLCMYWSVSIRRVGRICAGKWKGGRGMKAEAEVN